jgi:SAM-dependent methyltransferase
MPPPLPADLPPDGSRRDRPSSRPRTGTPSVLELVRLSPKPVFPPGGEDLYRQIARITELTAGQELLDSACGRGITTCFLAGNYGVAAHGIDTQPQLIDDAEQRAREAGLEGTVNFERGPLDDLPYKDGIFDVAIGEVGLGVAADPAAAIRELARVTRPRGRVVLVQLVWTGNLEDEKREQLVEHLGARPMLLVEWKQLLRDAGVVELHVEDWSDHPDRFRPGGGSPFHDMAAIFTIRQKLAILRRALKRWGWRGVRGAIVREQEIHNLLTRQRVLGLTLIIGTRWDA